MVNQRLIEQYKQAYKKANGDNCPYEIHYDKGLFSLENPDTGFDYRCRRTELVRIIGNLYLRTK